MTGVSAFWNAPKKKRGREFVFGSITERKMFPVHTIPTRMGIEQGIRGQPNRGPGCYAAHPSTLFLQDMDDRLKNRRGCGFGTRDSKRILFNIKDGPGPGDHQRLADPCRLVLERSFTLPFGAASPRFQPQLHNLEHLGPGSHDHDVPRCRHVLCNESFGSQRTLKGPVPIKCNLGIPEKCKQCRIDLVGDYYANKSATLCRSCYSQLTSITSGLLSATNNTVVVLTNPDQTKKLTKGTHDTVPLNSKHREEDEKDHQGDCEEDSDVCEQHSSVKTRISLKNMKKIRDCSSIHRHQFPGTLPKTIIMSDADQKKRARREAYLQLYFK